MPFDPKELIEEIKQYREKDWPPEAMRAKLRQVLSPVTESLQALTLEGLASDFEQFPIRGGIGCSCRIGPDKLIVAHCGDLLDADGSAVIRIGIGRTKLDIPGGQADRCPATTPNGNARATHKKILDFIVKTFGEQAPA